jgi:hypothetical protein
MTKSISIHSFVCSSLETFNLIGIYNPEEIITRIYDSGDRTVDLNTVDEVHFAWFKTACLALLTQLSQQHENKYQFNIALKTQHENKHQFNTALKTLFIDQTQEARSLWASIERMLWQFRLRGTYEVKDVVIEAYAIGIKKIQEGELRGACFNVIRDLRRKQDKAEKPKLDPTDLTPGDEAISEIIFSEDIKAVRIAWQKLSAQEQSLLRAKYIKGRSWQQIAESLSKQQCSGTNTAKQRGFRALQKLKQYYTEIREEVKLDDTDD